MDPTDRSLLAEKTFEFKSDEEDSSTESPMRKPSSVKIKLSKKTSNDSDSSPSPPPRKSPHQSKTVSSEDKPTSTTATTVFGQTANGSSVSYEPRATTAEATPVKSTSATMANGTSSGRKRGRPSLKQLATPPSNEETPVPEFNSVTPSVTTKFTTQRKPIVKPLAFMNPSTSNTVSGQHDIRTGFLSPFEEQEVLDALEQLGSKTFEEAEQKAKRRFEHILCLNLNRTHVDIPQECKLFLLFH